MASILAGLQTQILVDVLTTSIKKATFGTTGKTTLMPYAECYFETAEDVPADSNSFTDAPMSMFIVVAGSTEDDVQVALQELIALWKPDAIRAVLRALDCINIEPIRRYSPVSDPTDTVKKFYGMAQFQMTVRYTY